MRRAVVLGLIAVLTALLGGCAGPAPTPIPDDYRMLTIGDANPFPFEGLGAQFDSHFWLNNTASWAYERTGTEIPTTPEDWEIWLRRLDILRLDHCRVKIVSDWFEPQNDDDSPDTLSLEGFSWDNLHMTALYRVLDACQERGIFVNLSFYGVSIGNEWLATQYDPGVQPNWISRPKDLNEFAENVFAALYYLRYEREYTCINEFSVYPEPELNFLAADRSFIFSDYYELIRTVDAKLKREGIRRDFVFSGASEVANHNRLRELAGNVGECLDKFNGSWYCFRDNADAMLLAAGTEPYVYTACEYGKPYGAAELGSADYESNNTFGTFSHALYMTRFATAALAQGFTSMSYWILGSVYYDGTLLPSGLWKFKDQDWAPNCNYYTYGLLTRYTERGSLVYRMDSDQPDLAAVAMCSEEGKWTYAFTYDGDQPCGIAVINPHADRLSLKEYRVTEEELPAGEAMVSARTKHVTRDGTVLLTLRPQSFTVLSDLEW